MTSSAEVAAAVRTLLACDHFDESRRAAAALPDDISIVDILRAGDGAQRLARAVNTHRRTG